VSEYEIYAKRVKREASEGKPTIFLYDALPQQFRAQVEWIWKDTFGKIVDAYVDSLWRKLHDTVARELGMRELAKANVYGQEGWKCHIFLRESADTVAVLSLIEVSMRTLLSMGRVQVEHGFVQPADAIAELNRRFRENTLGYEFRQGRIVRADSEYLHSEVTEPALDLMHDGRFSGALDEFLEAHKHYLKGDFKPATVAASKALESTMKTILERLQVPFKPSADARDLIAALVQERVVPPYTKASLARLPGVRNQNTGAHGQGSVEQEVPRHEAAYCLHLAAADIVYLIKSFQALPSEPPIKGAPSGGTT
jgi:hypothetical protein